MQAEYEIFLVDKSGANHSVILQIDPIIAWGFKNKESEFSRRIDEAIKSKFPETFDEYRFSGEFRFMKFLANA